MYFPVEEYQERWSRLEEQIVQMGYRVAVIWQRSGGSYDRAGDVYYLTHYASHSSGQESSGPGEALGRSFAAVVHEIGKEPSLHVVEPVSTVDRSEVVCGEIVHHEMNLPAGLASWLRHKGIEGKIAYVGEDFLPVQMFQELRNAAPGIEWVGEAGLLYELQSHKSNRELQLYREAGQLASDALTTLMEALTRGERECDAAAAAASVIMRAGGGFQRVACHHGPKAEMAMWNKPLYGYSTDAPKPGDMVRGWVYGPLLEGYWIDPGRTAVCGNKPTSAQRKLIEDCVTVVNGVIDAHRPGVTGRQLGKVGDELIQNLGYGEDRGAGIWDEYGHGLSTFWLAPTIPAFLSDSAPERPTCKFDEPYHEGQVCTVEIFLHTRGLGTATFEQVLIVGATGAELLTTTPMVMF